MTLFTTILLFGQLSGGGSFSPPVPTEPPAPSVAAPDPAGVSPAEPPPVPASEPPVSISDESPVASESPAAPPAGGFNSRAAAEPGDTSLPGNSLRRSAQPVAQPAAQPDYAPATPSVSRPAAIQQPSAPATFPNNASQAPAGTANSQALQVASTMMEEILVLDEANQNSLRRVRLLEALSRIGDPAVQSTAIRAYWELARAIANARYAADKVRVLAEVSPPGDETERALLEEALASAEAAEAAAQDALLAAQYGLIRVSGLPAEDLLPWPADAPLVGSYRTQFETIFAGRPAPLSLRQIHHGLPGKLLLVEKRVAAVAAAEGATDAVLQAYKGGRATLSQLLPAVDRLDQSRRQFLDSIVDYNNQIADYAVAVVGGYGTETLVGTLIKSPATESSLVNIPRDVRQAAANQR